MEQNKCWPYSLLRHQSHLSSILVWDNVTHWLMLAVVPLVCMYVHAAYSPLECGDYGYVYLYRRFMKVHCICMYIMCPRDCTTNQISVYCDQSDMEFLV